MAELTIVKSWPATQAQGADFDPTPEEAQTLAEIRRRESGGDYGAKNTDSTASGAYQFINGTWRMASDATGVPQYAAAKDAPKWVQDLNALHMLRAYGPNASISWAASGPYKDVTASAPAQPPTLAQAGTADDVLARIGRGEQVNITPELILQTAFGAPQMAPAPKSAEAPLTIVKSWAPPAPAPLPEPSPMSKALGTFWAGTGKPFWDIIQGAQRNADPEVHQRAVDAFKGLVLGALSEPGRVTDEFFNQAGNAFLRGDISGGFRHVMGATPLFGSAMLEAAKQFDNRQWAELLGNTAAIVANAAAPGATDRVGEVIPAADAVVSGGVKGGYQAATETVPFKKYGLDIKIYKPVVTGAAGGAAAASAGLPKSAGFAVGAAAPIVRGIVRGAREALAEPPAPAPETVPQVPLPNVRGLPPPQIVTPAPADTSAVTAVPAQYPEVQPGFTPPDVTPSTTTTPWPGAPAAPAAPGLTFDDLARSLTNKSPSKLTQAERQTVQNIYDRMTSQPAAPPAPAPIRPPVSAPPTAPPEPPVAPAAPAAAPAVPPETAAPAAPATPTVPDQLFSYL